MGPSRNNSVQSNKVDQLTTQLTNFHQRRITNAADAVNSQDYVTLKQLKAMVAGVKPTKEPVTTLPGTGGGSGYTTNVGTDGYYVITIATGHATPLLSSGLNQEVDLTTASTIIDLPSGTPAPTTWTLIIYQDATGGRAVTFASGYLGAATLAGMLNLTANTYSAIIFVNQPSGNQLMKSIVTGCPTV